MSRALEPRPDRPPELSRPLGLDELGPSPRRVAVAATAEERTALARRFGLLRLDRLEAELEVQLESAQPESAQPERARPESAQPERAQPASAPRVAAGRPSAPAVRVRGRVSGRGTQPCVVTGEPVPAQVDERIELLFVRSVRGAPADPEAEVELGATDLDVVPMEGERLDLGEIVAQSFGLALDLYPRSPAADGAEVRRLLRTEEEAAADSAAATQAASPFAKLRPPG